MFDAWPIQYKLCVLCSLKFVLVFHLFLPHTALCEPKQPLYANSGWTDCGERSRRRKTRLRLSARAKCHPFVCAAQICPKRDVIYTLVAARGRAIKQCNKRRREPGKNNALYCVIISLRDH
jgi:hypothetical protein